MKKIVLFVFLAFAMGACKKTETTEKTVTTTEETSTVAMPETKSVAVKEYMEAYDAYLVEYKEAVKSKDQAKMVELGNKAQDLSTKGSAALASATGEDLEKLTAYMKAKTNEFVAISQGKY